MYINLGYGIQFQQKKKIFNFIKQQSELKKVEGIETSVAKKIHDFFHS